MQNTAMSQKLTLQELRSGMVPFLHYSEVEHRVQTEKQNRIDAAEQVSVYLMLEPMGDANDIETILSVDSTSEYTERLKLILATSKGSLEALDRVCMVICPEATSWAQRRSSETARRAIAQFWVNPGEPIPWYTAERFRLPADWLGRMRSNLAAEIHESLQSLYSTSYGFALEETIGSIVENEGYTREKGAVRLVDEKEVDVAVPDLRLPRVLIMSSYSLTTASSQGQRAREQQKMYEDVRRYNESRGQSNQPNVQLVNVIDGGGWIARSGDLRMMHQYCDYALAAGHLAEHLPVILHYHMRQGTRG